MPVVRVRVDWWQPDDAEYREFGKLMIRLLLHARWVSLERLWAGGFMLRVVYREPEALEEIERACKELGHWLNLEILKR